MTHFKPDYCSEKLVKCFVKITVYDTNFKLLVIKQQQKPITVAQHRSAASWKRVDAGEK